MKLDGWWGARHGGKSAARFEYGAQQAMDVEVQDAAETLLTVPRKGL